MRNLRIVDPEAQEIDDRVNILGVQVLEERLSARCQRQGRELRSGRNTISQSIFPGSQLSMKLVPMISGSSPGSTNEAAPPQTSEQVTPGKNNFDIALKRFRLTRQRLFVK